MPKQVKTRKCKLCGREFVPKSPSDKFCPGVCSMTAGLIKTPTERKASPPSNGWAAKEAKFANVVKVLKMPVGQRWKFAKDFTPEEQDFARKWAKREMALDNLIDYNCCSSGCPGGGDEEGDDSGSFKENSLGDSDDGSI